MPNLALERDAARSAAPLSLVRYTYSLRDVSSTVNVAEGSDPPGCAYAIASPPTSAVPAVHGPLRVPDAGGLARFRARGLGSQSAAARKVTECEEHSAEGFLLSVPLAQTRRGFVGAGSLMRHTYPIGTCGRSILRNSRTFQTA